MQGTVTARFRSIVITATITFSFTIAQAQAKLPSQSLMGKAHTQRLAPTDLEVTGDLGGLPPGTSLFLGREDLLLLPQVTYTVADDPNFSGSTEISGIPLEDLLRGLASAPDADMVTAVCDDRYHSHYPHAYLAAHHPLLVLQVNGEPPENWPKDAEGHGQQMGPYMISQNQFTPSFRVLAHQEEAQIPWGVVRLEFRNEKAVFGAIAPRGRAASSAAVQAGFRIAQQNCLRCHNLGNDGGQKARRPWLVLSAWAAAAPEYFAAYVRNPQAQNPQAQMYPNPTYDDATLQALTAYFRTFSSQEKP